MHNTFYFILLLFSFCTLFLNAGDKAKMLQDLEIIKATFETRYAPYEWKKSHFGWSLEEEINIAKIKILSLESLSVKDYQKILHTFFISTCDYHVHDEYYSTELSVLPFCVKSANGKYYVTKIQKDLLQLMKSKGQYKASVLPEIGDEIVLFDSTPIQKVIEKIKFHELGNPTSSTSQQMAEEILTTRLGKRAHQIPQGTIKIQFKRDNKPFNARMEWLYIPEKISNRKYLNSPAQLANLAYNFNENENFQARLDDLDANELISALKDSPQEILEKPKLMINFLAHDLQKDRSAALKKLLAEGQHANTKPEAKDFVDFDAKTLKTEKAIERDAILFGEKVWDESPKSTFKVHIYKLPGTDKLIGYIRMSTYMPSSENKVVNQMVVRLAKSIRYLQEHTDALVIDQIDNSGGIDLYAMAFLGMLTDRPLKIPLNHVTITQKDIAKAFTVIEAYQSVIDAPAPQAGPASSLLYGYPFNSHFVKCEIEYQNFIINQWDAGKTMTDAFPMHGIEKLPPHPLANYTKPLLVLVNSNDFSCGDFVPAILQDNNRALIFGERTAGAGGFVETHSYPNSFGLAEFSYTFSIAQRTNGAVIENLGVTPDVPYTITKADLLTGYQSYIHAVNKTLKKMLKVR